MKIIKLKQNELPSADSVIYPDLGLTFGILGGIGDRIDVCTKKNDNAYLCVSRTFLKIERNGVEYLLPYVNRIKCYGLIEFMNSLNNFISSVNIECQTIIEKYIVDESITTGNGDGVDIIIYKYKNN